MALIINHNMPAMVAARNLGSIYGSLGKSIERLSSGLRINPAADDAAGLAVREMMRADIATTFQGIRNAADAVSMIQTADGALAVIDAKLIRMKELAEQAATGTYTDFQREIINSEFQAMANEIDRIANATNFNGIKLLNGSTSLINGGQGILIHFGVGNNADEDFYYVSTGDVRATSSTGLNLGVDATNDIWSTGGNPNDPDQIATCCGGAFASAGAIAATSASTGLMLAYNWDLFGDAISDNGQSLITEDALGRHIVGRYTNGADTTISALIALVNRGSQSRVQINVAGGTMNGSGATCAAVICLGETERYYRGALANAQSIAGAAGSYTNVPGGSVAAIVSAINTYSTSYWALGSGENIWVFNKNIANGSGNSLTAGYRQLGLANSDQITFINQETGISTKNDGQFSLGGHNWITIDRLPGTGTSFNIALNGVNVGEGYDIKVVTATDTTFLGHLNGLGATAAGKVITSVTSKLVQVQDAEDGTGSVRTQATAQQALVSLNTAIEQKDRIRANLGAIQNRLEATIDNLTIQAENLQAAESRISDVDVATEMTEYTKNNILAQAAASMLAQANSLSSLALTLIRG
jgi:flagellin